MLFGIVDGQAAIGTACNNEESCQEIRLQMCLALIEVGPSFYLVFVGVANSYKAG